MIDDREKAARVIRQKGERYCAAKVKKAVVFLGKVDGHIAPQEWKGRAMLLWQWHVLSLGW